MTEDKFEFEGYLGTKEIDYENLGDSELYDFAHSIRKHALEEFKSSMMMWLSGDSGSTKSEIGRGRLEESVNDWTELYENVQDELNRREDVEYDGEMRESFHAIAELEYMKHGE